MLGWQGYNYKNVYKNVFIDKHRQLDIVENCKIFLRKIEELKLYMVEFEENDVIKVKIYLFDWIIYSNNCCPIIIIT